MAIEIKIRKEEPIPSCKEKDFRYSSIIYYKTIGTPIPRIFYTNHALCVPGGFILTEGNITEHNRPFCVVNTKHAAENALYHLAMIKAEERKNRLGTPKIIDETN